MDPQNCYNHQLLYVYMYLQNESSTEYPQGNPQGVFISNDENFPEL
jgi:hypothetical protein